MTPFVSRVVYRALVSTAGLARWAPFRGAWDRSWAAAGPQLSGSVPVRMHGERAVVNAGYAYPAFRRRWAGYNRPLVELVHQVHVTRGRRVVVVDVGAAVGDTVLLLRRSCPGAVDRFHCVEGDHEFFGYLSRNLARFPEVELHRAMLSDREGDEADLVRTHKGTASAQGEERRPAVPLDSVLGGLAVDVLKIDTDGFDGKVLAGATGLLSEHLPAVIFEWHPRLYGATGQDWRRPFEVLSSAGYDSFIWFTKFGELSHTDRGYQHDRVAVLADVCLAGQGPAPDWHYDVVALPAGSTIDPSDVAGLAYAATTRRRDRLRRSRASVPGPPSPTGPSRGRR